jgi:hypothetical protein
METVRLKYEDFIESEINNDYFSDTQKYARLGISFSKGKALAFTKEKDAEIRGFVFERIKKNNIPLSVEFVMSQLTTYLMTLYENGCKEDDLNSFFKQLNTIELKTVNIFLKIYNLCIDIDSYETSSFILFTPSYFIKKYPNPFMYNRISEQNTINTDNLCHTAIVFKNVKIIPGDDYQIRSVIQEKTQQFLNLISIALGYKQDALTLNSSFIHNSTEYHLLNENMVETSSSYSSDNSTFGRGEIRLKTNLFFNNHKNLFTLLDEPKTALQDKIFKSTMWLGKSLRNENIGDAFLQISIALECLLTRQEKNSFINPSITYSLSETLAFLVGNTKEERLSIFKDIKKLYSLRSAIVHSGKSNIEIKDYYNFFNFVRQGIYVILKLVEEKKYQNIDDIYSYIDDLKFS